MQCKVVAAGIAVLWQIDGLLELPEQGQIQCVVAVVFHLIVNGDGVVIALKNEGFGVDNAVCSSIGQRDSQLIWPGSIS